MSQQTVKEFITSSAQNDAARGKFELENPYLLEVNLSGRIFAKLGSMIAYTGEVKFEREGILDHGVAKMLKKAVSGEGTSLMKVVGGGRVYFADLGKRVQILKLEGDTFFVNGNDLLAFEDSIEWDIKLMRRMAGVLAGGLFNVRLSGTGLVAITTHFNPIALQVKPGQPVFTDPSATVAWAGTLTPDIVTDISLRTFLGRGSKESVQLKFDGTGWVLLQPYEEIKVTQHQPHS